MAVATVVVTVAGRLDDAAFQQVKKAVEFLAATEPGFVANVVSLLPVDYDLFLQRVLPESFPTVAKHSEPVLTYVGSADTTGGATFVGGLNPSLAWLKGTFRYEDATHSIFYHRLAKMEMRGYVAKTKREYCALEVTKHGEGPIGTLVIELFTDIAPRTCDNFINFVKGTACGAPDDTIPGAVKKYEGCFIHRIVKDGWVQTGDVVCVGGPVGTGITSHFAEGTAFGDETFFVKHDKPGIVSMAIVQYTRYTRPAKGRLPLTVQTDYGGLRAARERVSIFSHDERWLGDCSELSLQIPAPWMDGRRVAFGRVIRGTRVLKLLNELPCTFAERPMADVRLGRCEMVTESMRGGDTATENGRAAE